MRKTQYVALCCFWACSYAPNNVCGGNASGPLPSEAEVCNHVESLSCFASSIQTEFDGGDAMSQDAGTSRSECLAGAEEFRTRFERAGYEALLRCYVAARSCSELEVCSRGCQQTRVDASIDAASDATSNIDSSMDSALDTADAQVVDVRAADAQRDSEDGALDAIIDALSEHVDAHTDAEHQSD